MANFNMQDFVDAWNSNDPNRIAGFYADDATVQQTGLPQPLRGKDEIRRNLEEFFESVKDFRGELQKHVQTEDTIAGVLRIRARHTGELELVDGVTVPPSNREIEYEASFFTEVGDDGKIRSERDVIDLLSLVAQTGAKPEQLRQMFEQMPKPR